MRTTIRLDDQLLKEAKGAAAATGRSLTQFMEDSLRETLARRRGQVGREPVALRSFKGKGLRPGADLDDWAALEDAMAGPDAPA